MTGYVRRMRDQGRSPASSAVEQNVYKVFPNDLNAERTVFGGLVMGLCDRTALIVAERHSGHVCVTAAADSFQFLAPARTGDTLLLKASVNRSWRSSMEIGVRVAAEDTRTRETRHVVSAYFTFVALDDDGRPTDVPSVLPDTEAEERRFRDAQRRREGRLAMRTPR